jgi:hypothetical protein
MGDQASSVYPWAQQPPGVTYNGGIPARTTQCGATLTPSGGDDTTQIQNAINACPAGQHVQLGAGVFLLENDGMIRFTTANNNDNITLRGVGPGNGNALPGDYVNANGGTNSPSTANCGSPCTILFKVGWGSGVNPLIAINQNASETSWQGTSINLAADAVQGSNTITLASAPSGAGWTVGSLVLIDMQTANPSTGASTHPDAYYSPAFGSAGSASYCWFSRCYRALAQIVKITAVNGNVVTIQSPLSMTYAVAYSAQLTPFNVSGTRAIVGVGIENMYLYGGSRGNFSMELCDSCWVKHVESHWTWGVSIQLTSTYRSEVRDSYIHESQHPTSGGAGYLFDLAVGSANSLVENNIMWNGDKVMVMRSSGGGNVVAYNYMDDSYDFTDPPQAEVGINASHYVGSHFELLEGNWSHKYFADTFWGNSVYITAFRNRLTGLRGARTPMNTFFSGGYPYCDCWTRSSADVGSYSYYHSMVGNVLGFNPSKPETNQPVNAQGLLNGVINSNTPGFTATQTTYTYESFGTEDDVHVPMYAFGADSGTGGYPPPQPTIYQQINRQGNWDFFTNSQIWYATYGGSGTTSTGPPLTLPNSLYLTSAPAFFGTMTWPWVNPSNGTTATLPAKARFDAGTPNIAVGGAAPLQ